MVARPVPLPPGPGQESVWDYPRPPRVEPFGGSIEIHFGGRRIARTDRAHRVLTPRHPPPSSPAGDPSGPGVLRPTGGPPWGEWKGQASYFDVVVGDAVAPRAAWTYETPTPGFEAIAGAIAVMARAMDRCTVNGEVVTPQPGGFYGGWVTSAVVGPFKGEPGTMGW